MNPKVKLGAVAVLAASAMITPTAVSAATAPAGTAAAAASDQPAFSPPDAEARNRAAATAGATIAARSAELLKGQNEKFTLTANISGAHGLQYLTYARTYRGLPVYGGEVIVSTDRAGELVGSVFSGQQSKITIDVTSKVDAATAAATARAQLSVVESVSTPKLVVHAATETPRLAWEVVVNGGTAEAPSVLHVFVNAVDGSIVDSYDDVRAGTGNSYYNGNPVTIQTSGSGPYSMTDTTRPGLRCGGQGGSAYTKATNSWGTGSGTNLETACVDALYAAQTEWNMLSAWLSRTGFNGSGGAFPARVGLNAVNAYWNGSYTNFGHNQANTRQATPMDVVAHEYGHAIFQYSGASGGSSTETGGLNESTGDIFGALTEHYANQPATLDPPDYLVGEEVDLVGSGPIRNMYNPAALGDPNCYSSSIPTTEVHAAAGPQNHWFYLLAEGTNPVGKPASPVCSGPTPLVGIGIQKAGKIFQGGLNSKTAPWTHAKARKATVAAAKSLYPGGCVEVNAVKAAWSAVNVPAVSGEVSCP